MLNPWEKTSVFLPVVFDLRLVNLCFGPVGQQDLNNVAAETSATDTGLKPSLTAFIVGCSFAIGNDNVYAAVPQI